MPNACVSGGRATAGLSIDLFGHVTLRDSARRSISAPKAVRELAGCLALHALARPLRREVLAEMLWPGSGAEASRQRLRTVLWRLRGALGETLAGHVRHDGDAVWLDGVQPPDSDHARFESGISAACATPLDALTEEDAAALERTLALYAAPLMEGHDGAWIVPHRERFAALYCRGLERQIAWHGARGEADALATAARRLLEVDPYREDIHALLIGHYAGSGQPGRALRQFDACRAAVEQDLGLPAPLARDALGAAQAAAQRAASARSLAEGPATPTVTAAAELARMLAGLDASIARLNRQIGALCERLEAVQTPRSPDRRSPDRRSPQPAPRARG